MAGHLLGISGEEMASRIGEVEAFAEIGDYIDQPVRTYSSGMQVRLAFGVATTVRPDILIVDEALSVGDTYFQHKSFDRIRQFREQGTTLLFVSHSPGAVKTLCDRALLLDHGLMLRDDKPEVVLDYYNAMIAAQRAEHQIRQTVTPDGRRATRSGTAEATIEQIELVASGRRTKEVRSGEPVIVRVAMLANTPLKDLTAGILVRDRLGNDVFGTNTFHLGACLTDVHAGTRAIVEFTLPRLCLGVGSYSVTAALHTGDSHVAASFDWWDRALVFRVLAGEGPVSIGVCVLDVEARWVTAGSLAGTHELDRSAQWRKSNEMIDFEDGDLDLDSLMERIRDEVNRRKAMAGTMAESSRGSSGSSTQAGNAGLAFSLPRLPDGAGRIERKPSYALREFLDYHDEEFVRNAYIGLLQREPDAEGFSSFLEALRRGQLGKAEILGRMRLSPEGRASGIRVRGLGLAFALRTLQRLPVLGQLIGIGYYLLRLPDLARHHERFEAGYFQRHVEITRQLNRQFQGPKANPGDSASPGTS